MKIVIKRIESINRSGTTNKGKDYHIDTTTVYSDVPFDVTDANGTSFGTKELGYQVGEVASHANFDKFGLDKLRGHLPLEVDAEMGQTVNQFGQPIPCILSIKLPTKVNTNV